MPATILFSIFDLCLIKGNSMEISLLIGTKTKYLDRKINIATSCNESWMDVCAENGARVAKNIISSSCLCCSIYYNDIFYAHFPLVNGLYMTKAPFTSHSERANDMFGLVHIDSEIWKFIPNENENLSLDFSFSSLMCFCDSVICLYLFISVICFVICLYLFISVYICLGNLFISVYICLGNLFISMQILQKIEYRDKFIQL
ncbi:hypothetical protein ACJX0J_007891, partial [Zea mays]